VHGAASLGQAGTVVAVGFTPAEMKALRITDAIENTAWYVPRRTLAFGSFTGDFDGQGLSLGLLQWNIGTGSLQPLLQAFAREHPDRFAAAFGAEADELRAVLREQRPRQLAWARGINTGDRRQPIREPWSSHFRRLGEDAAFQRIQLRAVRPRMDAARRYGRHFGLTTERGLALMFDIVTQQGAYWITCKRERCVRRARLIQERRDAEARRLGRELSELELMAIIANVVGDVALERWREKVRDRKMMIVRGRGRVHGHEFDLARDFGLTDGAWDTGTPQPPAPGGATRVAVPALFPPGNGGAAAAAAPAVNPRAVELNRRFADSLRWGPRRAEIALLLGFRDHTPDELRFAEGLARWQQAQGLTPDGVLGPTTWARLQPRLHAGTAPPPASAPPSPAAAARTPAEAFAERVLERHIARSTARRKPLRDLAESELATVSGTEIKMRADAAREAGRLLADANRALAAARAAGNPDALRTTAISAGSGYRGRAHQETVWRNNFKRYYAETAAAREKLPGGPHGDAAVAHMVDYVAWRVAPPGFSLHQAGTAIDFQQKRSRGSEIGNSTASDAIRRWQATWFFRWLQENAKVVYGFHPYPKEPWHWEYGQRT
jgi:LAS superfamily LD-carboxypeptidase LdcB